jgi:hypothetical protein
MSKYEWSTRSRAVLETLHPDLQKIANLAIQRTTVDMVLVEGARTIASQRAYFKDGLSKINPDAYESETALCKVAKHITITEHPLYEYSRALDFCAYAFHKGKNLSYDIIHLTHIATVIEVCAKELYSKGVIDHLIRSGLNFNMDGILKYDSSFVDAPHVELYKPKK